MFYCFFLTQDLFVKFYKKFTISKHVTVISVTPEEIRHWHDGFLKDCPTGKLTKNEFAKIYNQFFPHGDPSAFAA